MTQTVEHLFMTRDVNRTFNMIEDEDGDVFWGFGHREAPEFTNEVNQWLISECGVTDPDDLFAASQPVEHLWAYMDGDSHRFKLAKEPDPELNTFPVTRLMI